MQAPDSQLEVTHWAQFGPWGLSLHPPVIWNAGMFLPPQSDVPKLPPCTWKQLICIQLLRLNVFCLFLDFKLWSSGLYFVCTSADHNIGFYKITP